VMLTLINVLEFPTPLLPFPTAVAYLSIAAREYVEKVWGVVLSFLFALREKLALFPLRFPRERFASVSFALAIFAIFR
jgi:hypothetical protein